MALTIKAYMDIAIVMVMVVMVMVMVMATAMDVNTAGNMEATMMKNTVAQNLNAENNP